MSFDIAVLGAGPAGMAAATEAARRGARVVLLEEAAAPGGQVFRAPAPGFVMPADKDSRAGDTLRAALAGSGADLRAGCRVWGVGGGTLVAAGQPAAPFRLDALAEDSGPFHVQARALVVCAGTHERIIPFAGWTLPGVMGLAAATVLMKAHGVLPGRRVVVAGAGPLLFAVAARIRQAGAQVAAVVDVASAAEWARALPAFRWRPDLLARGAAWRAALLAARVPVLRGHRIAAAEGGEAVERVRLVPIGGGAGRTLECDAVCVGHGLVPATEATRALRAAHRFDAEAGGWVPDVDAEGRCSVPLLFAAGDGAGLRGAAAAPEAGRLAALAAMRDLGLLDARAQAAARGPIVAALKRQTLAGAAMARLMVIRPALVAAIAAETVVCRCEGIPRSAVDAAMVDGAASMNQLKHFCRLGMGACQGRFCGEAAAELLAARFGGRLAVGVATGRVPLRPVPMDALLGDFDYADIPVPAAAPI